MGLARSHMRDLFGRGEEWADGRSHRTPSDDAGLLAELRQQIADLPNYGYRRACALVNRQRAARPPRVHANASIASWYKPLCCCPRRLAGASLHARMRAVLRSRAATLDGAPMVWKSSAILGKDRNEFLVAQHVQPEGPFLAEMAAAAGRNLA